MVSEGLVRNVVQVAHRMLLVEVESADSRRIRLEEEAVDNRHIEVAQEECRIRMVVGESEVVLQLGTRNLVVVAAVGIRNRSAMVLDRRGIAVQGSRT